MRGSILERRANGSLQDRSLSLGKKKKKSAKGETKDDDAPPSILFPDSIFFNHKWAVIDFESTLFKGRAILRVKNCIKGGGGSYFKGRKRKFQMTIQGRFKRRLSMGSVVTGQEFDCRFKKLPPTWAIRSVLSVMQALSPSLQSDLTCDQPYARSAMAATVQAMSVTDPDNKKGRLPDIMEEPVENTKLIRKTNGQPINPSKRREMTSQQRKKYFSKRKNLLNSSFDPCFVYTFDFYQHMLQPSTFEFDAGVPIIGNVLLAPYLDGQPIQLMAKLVDTDDYLWNFELWHQQLIT